MPFEIKLNESNERLLQEPTTDGGGNIPIIVPMCVDGIFYTSERLKALFAFCLGLVAQKKGYNITFLVAGYLNRHNEQNGQADTALVKAQKIIEQIQECYDRTAGGIEGVTLQVLKKEEKGAASPGGLAKQWLAVKDKPNMIKVMEWAGYLEAKADDFRQATALIEDQDALPDSKLKKTLDKATMVSGKAGKAGKTHINSSRAYLKEESAALLVMARDGFKLHMYVGYLNSSQNSIYQLVEKSAFAPFVKPQTLPKHLVFAYVDLAKDKEKVKEADRVAEPLHPMAQLGLMTIKVNYESVMKTGQLSKKQKALYAAQIALILAEINREHSLDEEPAAALPALSDARSKAGEAKREEADHQEDGIDEAELLPAQQGQPAERKQSSSLPMPIPGRTLSPLSNSLASSLASSLSMYSTPPGGSPQTGSPLGGSPQTGSPASSVDLLSSDDSLLTRSRTPSGDLDADMGLTSTVVNTLLSSPSKQSLASAISSSVVTSSDLPKKPAPGSMPLSMVKNRKVVSHEQLASQRSVVKAGDSNAQVPSRMPALSSSVPRDFSEPPLPPSAHVRSSIFGVRTRTLPKRDVAVAKDGALEQSSGGLIRSKSSPADLGGGCSMKPTFGGDGDD